MSYTKQQAATIVQKFEDSMVSAHGSFFVLQEKGGTQVPFFNYDSQLAKKVTQCLAEDLYDKFQIQKLYGLCTRLFVTNLHEKRINKDLCKRPDIHKLLVGLCRKGHPGAIYHLINFLVNPYEWNDKLKQLFDPELPQRLFLNIKSIVQKDKNNFYEKYSKRADKMLEKYPELRNKNTELKSITTNEEWDKINCAFDKVKKANQPSTKKSTLQSLLEEVNGDRNEAARQAAAQNRVDWLEELCNDHKINLNEKSKTHMTPLMYAAKERALEAVRFLLAKEVDRSLTCKEGRTALHYAAGVGENSFKYEIEQKQLQVCKLLVDEGALTFDCEDKDGVTAMSCLEKIKFNIFETKRVEMCY